MTPPHRNCRQVRGSEQWLAQKSTKYGAWARNGFNNAVELTLVARLRATLARCSCAWRKVCKCLEINPVGDRSMMPTTLFPNNVVADEWYRGRTLRLAFTHRQGKCTPRRSWPYRPPDRSRLLLPGHLITHAVGAPGWYQRQHLDLGWPRQQIGSSGSTHAVKGEETAPSGVREAGFGHARRGGETLSPSRLRWSKGAAE